MSEAQLDHAAVRFLDDVTVLEVASLAPTQLGMHLADLGAEVIKIEPPKRGDATRLIDRRPGFRDSGLHRRWNRGKKSLALDMTTTDGRAVFARLVPRVDILIEGLRPGSLERMGFGWAELTQLKPDLVFVALSGYGQAGPYRDLPSHGIGFDAVSGLAPVDEDEHGRPSVAPRHLNFGTMLAPMFATSAALAALSWTRRTGEPAFLDVAQADAAAFANFAIEDLASRERAAAGSTSAANESPAPARRVQTMQYYRTGDDKVLLLMALERKFFVRLARAIDRPDLLRDLPEDQYTVQVTDEMHDILVDVMASKSLDEWMRMFAEADVPVVPVNDTAQVLDDPHLKTRIAWMSADQQTVTMKTPVRSTPDLVSPRPAPAIGMDTVEILSMVGLEESEIERLADAGVVEIAPFERDRGRA